MVQGKLRQPHISLGRIFPVPTPVIGTAKDVACGQATQRLFSGQLAQVATKRLLHRDASLTV